MKTRTLAIALAGFAFVLGTAALHTATSSAQQPQWSWPEKSKNLKVLPKDTDPQKLRAVMGAFTRSLGVRCNHCHVGKEGQPLSTFDFASDENPKKDIARGMMRMADSVNAQVARMVPNATDRVSVGCFTCHHGLPRPRTLGDELANSYDTGGADSTISKYRALRTRYYGSAAYDFGEGALGEVARRATDKKDYPGAIAIHNANVQQFPESGFVRAGLGEAYLAAGDTAKAYTALEKSVQLDPRNERASRTLESLKKAGWK